MTPEQFCYWMNGYVDLNGDTPNEDQWAVIVEHLQTVFKKTTVLTVDKLTTSPDKWQWPHTPPIEC